MKKKTKGNIVKTYCTKCRNEVEQVLDNENTPLGVEVSVYCHGEEETRRFPLDDFKSSRIKLVFFSDSGSN